MTDHDSKRRKISQSGRALSELYDSVDAFPADFLARNQREPERAAKILTKAHERRLAKNARRLKHAEASGQRRPVFKLDLRTK